MQTQLSEFIRFRNNLSTANTAAELNIINPAKFAKPAEKMS